MNLFDRVASTTTSTRPTGRLSLSLRLFPSVSFSLLLFPSLSLSRSLSHARLINVATSHRAVQNSSHQLATFARPTDGLKSAKMHALPWRGSACRSTAGLRSLRRARTSTRAIFVREFPRRSRNRTVPRCFVTDGTVEMCHRLHHPLGERWPRSSVCSANSYARTT